LCPVSKGFGSIVDDVERVCNAGGAGLHYLLAGRHSRRHIAIMKTVVITGSTRGIGFGLAGEFLARDLQVVVSGRSLESVNKAVVELSSMHKAERIFGLPCDVAKLDQMQQLWDEAVKRFGRVDIWINNAGVNAPRTEFWNTDEAAIHSAIHTNLIGTMYGCQVAIRGMLAQAGGQVWNMEGFGSNGKFMPGFTLYGTTKSAVTYFTQSLIREVEGTLVQVGTISPGMVDTDLLRRDYTPAQWERSKRILNILTDKVETVAPALADKILATDKNGSRVEWLSNVRIAGRFLTARIKPRHVID
jgi:NAD(P)-dependent dehydrogenase (short-subunit alcohol dehydrogenase family)